jgi:hypothetical protein
MDLYCTLQVQGSTARAVIERESANPLEQCAPMSHAEICRHAANVAELACAAVNPVKKRHFYLAMKTDFKASTSTGLQAATILTRPQLHWQSRAQH